MTLEGRSVYERDYGYLQHDHLDCQICNKLIEFHSRELQELCDAVAAEHKFRAGGHRLIVSGTCYDCRTERHRRKSRWI
jgi:Fur family ferric uptake transcriptional regulator